MIGKRCILRRSVGGDAIRWILSNSAQIRPPQQPSAITRKGMVWSRTDSEIPYSPKLEGAFKLILENPVISGSPERPSLVFIRAARFLKSNAPHVFQIRKMGARSENRMDRWLWDFLA
jgi:hypothetical protein